MFEHFTFGAQAQNEYHDDVSASPTDTSYLLPLAPPPSFAFTQHQNTHHNDPPSPPSEINDLVYKLSKQSIRPQDINIPQYNRSLPNPPFARTEQPSLPEPNHHVSQPQSVPPALTASPISSGNVACRRFQRQLNVHLQCSTTHLRNINALVESMIVSNEQCNLISSPSISTTRPYPSSPCPSRCRDRNYNQLLEVDNSATREFNIPFGEPIEASEKKEDEDEGGWDLGWSGVDGEEEMSLRRASTPSGVRKLVTGMKYRASAECVGGVAGRPVMVRCLPRMRKRKVGRVLE